MKNKLMYFACVTLIFSLSILYACSSEDVNGLLLETSVNDCSLKDDFSSQNESIHTQNTASAIDSTIDDTPLLNVPPNCERVDICTTTLELMPIDPDDRVFHEIGMSIALGYVYFDFAGNGVPVRVVFDNSPNPIGGSDFSIGMDTRVSVEVDGNWQYVWFFSTQLMLTLVKPVNYWQMESFSDLHALLVVGEDVGNYYHARLVVFEDGELKALSLIPEDSRPDWYWTWQEHDDT